MARDDAITTVRFPIRLLTIALVLTTVAFVWFGWVIFDLGRDAKIARDQSSRMEELRGAVLHFGEVLGGSVRLAVTTGDSKWEERYRRFEPQLDAVINEVKGFATHPSSARAAAQTDEANIKLVKMENQAFDLVRAGRMDEARAVIFSPEFENEEQIYAQGSAAFIDQIKREADELERRDKRIDFVSLIGALVVLAISFAAWLSVVRGLKRWRADLEQAVSERQQAEQALRRANDELELRIEQRTAELEKTNQALHAEIAGRQQIERELRQSEERFRIAAETANDVIYEWDLKQSVEWQGKIDDLLGDEPGEFPRTLNGWADSVHPEDLERTMAAIQAHLEGRGPYATEYRVQRKDGVYRWWSARGAATRMPDGRPTRWIGSITDITERKRVEEQIERLSRFPSENPYPVLRVSAQGILEYANAASDTLLASMGAKVGGPLNPEWQARIAETFANAHPVNIEFQAGDRTFSAALSPVSNHGYVNLYAGDITERKLAENALRESNEKFHQLADNITDAFWIRSTDLREVHYISPAFERIWGRSVESLYANPQQWPDLILPEDRERVLAAFATFKEDSPNLDIQYRIVRPDGEIRWVYLRAFQVRDAADKLVRLTGIVTDITERKRNEISALAFSKLGSRLSSAASAREAFAIIKEVSQELFGWDAFTIRLYDAQADSFYAGFVIDTIAGQEVAEEQNEPVKPGELYRRIMTRGGELILRDLPSFGPGTTPFGDVSRPSAVLMFAPIRSRGHAVGVLSIQSYTPNAYNERDLQTLQTMADQCGGAIDRIWADEALHKTEARLFHSQKLETVGKLAGGVAHEFNSILTAIIGQSELLLADLPSESPLIENATEISKAAGRAATLTRQLLAYGRKQFLQPEILDLNAVLAGMESTLRHLMGRAVDVRIAPATGLKAVKADAGQIEQVIMNLAMNAADAMPSGGKLTLETGNVSFDPESVGRYPELQPGDYVMLAITDTGAGMNEAVKARAFEPFFTTKGVGQGTGLGLSTGYGIIKQSGGHISVYSEPGRGTTFKIYLPQVEPQAKIHTERLDSPDLPRGTETILLVEDDPALREMAAILLRRLGYTVLPAADGLEALSLKVQRGPGPIDLLFTDLVMSHMSGKELADRVQALDPQTRILFTSAYTTNAIVHQGVLNEGLALLQKPFTPSALAHKLREVLDQPGAPQPDPAQKTFGFTINSGEAKPSGN